MILLLLLFIMLKWHAKFRYTHTNIHKYTHTLSNKTFIHKHILNLIKFFFVFIPCFVSSFIVRSVGSFKHFVVLFYLFLFLVVVFIWFFCVFIENNNKIEKTLKNTKKYTYTQQHKLKPWGWIKDVFRLLFFFLFFMWTFH